jgi:hypothetical protein
LAHPGVIAAGYTSFLPLVLGGSIWPVQIQGHPENPANRRTASLRFVTTGFFSAMRIPLLAGRDVRKADSHKAPFVALVSQSFAQRYWPKENPLGRPSRSEIMAYRHRCGRRHPCSQSRATTPWQLREHWPDCPAEQLASRA